MVAAEEVSTRIAAAPLEIEGRQLVLVVTREETWVMTWTWTQVAKRRTMALIKASPRFKTNTTRIAEVALETGAVEE